MRILIVNTYHFYGGGDSTYAFNLAGLLKSKGHNVAFFAMQDSRNLPDPNSDLFVSNIDFRELNRHKNLFAGIRVLGRSVYSIEARRKFAALLDRFQPDVVHLQNIHAHITPSVIFEARQRHIPIVWTLHDYRQMCPNSVFMIDRTREICEACRGGKYYHAIIKRCKKNSLLASSMVAAEAYAHLFFGVRTMVEFFLVPSVFMCNKLLENGFNAQKVIHIPLFVPKPSLGEINQQPSCGYFLFLGRLDLDKGINTLIEACRAVPKAKVILAGRVDEPFKSAVIDHMPGNMKYVGIKTGSELDELRRNSFAFILPSLSYENQPFSVMEAFAFGKPVIASGHGGIIELVGSNNERGILVPPGTPEALAAAIAQAMKNPSDMTEKGDKAHRFVLANHSADVHYAHLVEIYRNVIANSK